MLASRNYAPSSDLEPFIVRHYIFAANLPKDFELIDGILAETPMVRVLLGGDWAAEMAPGDWRNVGQTVMFGANAVPLRVRVRGPFNVVGFAIRPSGWKALFAKSAAHYADDMVPLNNAWGDLAIALLTQLQQAGDDDAVTVMAMENIIREQLIVRKSRSVNDAMARFEVIARHNSTIMVKDAAEQIGLPLKKMERHCVATFGHSPKIILRRSRFLDLATAIRGISDPSQDERAALRFSDQSHIHREFRHFIDMTPREFTRAETPLMTAGLRLRHEGLGWGGPKPE